MHFSHEISYLPGLIDDNLLECFMVVDLEVLWIVVEVISAVVDEYVVDSAFLVSFISSPFSSMDFGESFPLLDDVVLAENKKQ